VETLLTKVSRDLLREALSICDIRKQNVTDRARVLNKLSQALAKMPGHEAEAEATGKEALELYHKLALPQNKKDAPNDYDYDLLVCGLHR
jgi:hypothetical protein